MKNIFYNINHIIIHCTYIESSFVNHIFNLINKIRKFPFFITVVCFYIIGFISNYIFPFPRFVFFQSLFVTIFTISFFSIRYYERKMTNIHLYMAGDSNLYQINDNVHRLRRSLLNIIIPMFACIYFGILVLILVNIKINSISAAYLILCYILCVLLSLLGYLQYVYLFIYIWKLRKNNKKIKKYNKDYPAHTNWVVSLAKLYSSYRNIFFVLGATYVFGVIYFVLCGSYRVIEKIEINQYLNIVLALFWGGVLFAIVIFFPISSILEYSNIKTIINTLKEQTIVEINIDKIKNRNDEQIALQKSNFVIALLNTPEYPIRDTMGIIFSGMMTFINLVASITAILQYYIASG